MEQKTISISGMHCTGCAQSVEKSLKNVEKVRDANVNLAGETATVFFENGSPDPEALRNAVEQAGFKIAENWKSAGFRVEGMHCAGCVNSVNKALNEKDGVRNVQVNLANDKAFLEYDESKVGVEDLVKAVEQTGYSLIEESRRDVNKLEEKRKRDREKLEAARKKLIWSWVITGPIMGWMAVEMILGIHLGEPLVMESIMTVAAAVVIFKPGWETLVSAWKSGKNLSPNMDVLIAIGTTASLSTGIIAILHYLGWIVFPMHSFAGIAAMIMAFHLTGRYIETKARGHASDAITKLLTLEADTARIIRDGMEKEISVRELNPGDVMIVRPGEKVPTDGEVVSGSGTINESMVTGESMPVRKSKGDEVIGGTINEEGSLRVKATAVGEDTFLNRVVRLVEEAQGTKVPIQDYADRVTAIFVPVVLVLALVTFVSWLMVPNLFAPVIDWAESWIPWVEADMGLWSQAFFAALAVLVIACPCALGLATPTALMVGSGLGAENGILIRRGEAIQRLQDVTHFVFDKTGTLTEGEPSVTDVEFFTEDDAQVLSLICSVENPSEHPISRAITKYGQENGIPFLEVEDFKSWPGLGVGGRINQDEVIIGNRTLMEKEGIAVESKYDDAMAGLENQGKTVVIAVVNRQVNALIAVADTIKPETQETIRKIHEQGYKTVMITGDNRRVAKAISEQLGIGDVLAEVLPDEKEGRIRELQEQGHIVVMVGDGVNDAPALTRADVGMAIGTGTDIAIESGSIVLVDGKLTAVLKALELSRATFRKIRQNLFWAYFYNVIMIPVAVIGLMHPVLAEAAMAFSSVNVVANSKRLQKKRI